MQVNEFIAQRRPDWERLDKLLRRSGPGHPHALSDDELLELGRLYRATSSDLAQAQRDYPDHELVTFLNQLVARSHNTVYRTPSYTPGRMLSFLNTRLPRLYRESAPFILAAVALFVLPALMAGVATASSSNVAVWLGFEREAAIMRDGQLWTNLPIAQRPGAASAIMQNNLGVTFLAFTGGLPFGVLTVYVMVRNGVRIGALLGLALRYGLGGELLTFIVGHGVLEFSVIFVAGGCGLMIGQSLLRPGYVPRRDALVVAARRAAQLLSSCVPLLLVAGVIEAFISPSALPAALKWAVGLASGAAWYAYLWMASRD